jgi:uncharacterized protein DUF5655
VTRWTCPECDREFGRAKQSHVCVPGCTLDECFAGRPAVQRRIYNRIIESLGPVHTDVVKVGVFLKRERKLAELRPKARSLNLYLNLPRPVDDQRVIWHVRGTADTVVHFFKLTALADVDDQLRGWLAQAYDFAS